MGVVSDWDKVSGNVSEGVSTPVVNLCDATYLAGITITAEYIQDFRDNATITITGNYELILQSILPVSFISQTTLS